MNARHYVVRCMVEGCSEEARYKVASQWSDGTIQELKTYGLACEQHLELIFGRSRDKHGRCRLVEGESLGLPQIFRIEPGQRDRQLVHLPELEAKLAR